MKKVWLLFFLCIFGTHNLMAETCIGKNWTVSYSCGKGTVKNKLPENQVATYGSEFTPVLLNTEYCTPPSGMAISGIEIWVGDSYNGAFSKTGAKFMYYYASDVVIKPRYMGVADINKLWVLRGVSGESRTYNASGRTWQVVFPYGTVSGIAACSNVKPKKFSARVECRGGGRRPKRNNRRRWCGLLLQNDRTARCRFSVGYGQHLYKRVYMFG